MSKIPPGSAVRGMELEDREGSGWELRTEGMD